MGQHEKRPSSQDNHKVMLCGGRRVLITQNTLSSHADSQHSHEGGYSSAHHHTHTNNTGISQNADTRAHTDTAKPYSSHLNCRAHSPSCSTGAQSLTTDIILIAHHSQVVCPHSHPDSLCAQNPITENSGLTVSGGLWTAASVYCVSLKSIFLLSLQLHCCIPHEHRSSGGQTQSHVCGTFWTLHNKKERTLECIYVCVCNLPSLLCDKLWQAGRWWSDGDVRRPRPLWCWVAVTLELPSAEKVSC